MIAKQQTRMIAKQTNKEQNKQEKDRYMHGKLKKRQSHRKCLKMRVPHQFATCAANKSKTKQTKQRINKKDSLHAKQQKQKNKSQNTSEASVYAADL